MTNDKLVLWSPDGGNTWKPLGDSQPEPPYMTMQSNGNIAWVHGGTEETEECVTCGNQMERRGKEWYCQCCVDWERFWNHTYTP